jgi:hypothetical protein
MKIYQPFIQSTDFVETAVAGIETTFGTQLLLAPALTELALQGRRQTVVDDRGRKCAGQTFHQCSGLKHSTISHPGTQQCDLEPPAWLWKCRHTPFLSLHSQISAGDQKES